MQGFNFRSALDPKSAIASHQSSLNSQYLAGGTNLVDLLKLHVEKPDHLIDISPLKLKSIRDENSSLYIGALITNADLANHAAVQRHFPMLSQAILSGASPQLRNLATTSGNLMQRTRCSYFRDSSCPCNKRDPQSGCSAIGGVNRNLAILGVSSSCIASNPSDMNVALMALDAIIHVKAHNEDRKIKFADFFLLPGKTPHLETSLKKDELITEIEIPKRTWFQKSLYVKVRDRASYSFALTSAAVALDLHQNIIKESRIALGGVGSIPWRSKEAEEILNGQKISKELIVKAANAALADAKPLSGNRFKVALAERTLVSALQKCGGIS